MDNPLFEASYCRVFHTDIVGIVGEDPAVDAFFEDFYHHFLQDEALARLFADTDMARQVSMLKNSLFQLTSCAVLGRPSDELVRLAGLHKRLGINPALLDKWFEALINTVADADPEYNEATRLAWCWAIAPGIFFMKSFLDGEAESTAPVDTAPPSHWDSGAYDPSGPRAG